MPAITKSLFVISAVLLIFFSFQSYSQELKTGGEKARTDFELAEKNYPGKRIDLFVEGMNTIEKSNSVEVFIIQYSNRILDYEMHPEKGMASLILTEDTDIKDIMEAFEQNNYRCSFIDADGFLTTLSLSGNLNKFFVKK